MGAVAISKSKYMAGLQCPKLLWTWYNDKALIPEVDAGTQVRFDQGKEVGKLAQTLFPGGIELPWSTIGESIRATAPLLEGRNPIFEASFSAGGVYARADILDPAPRGAWDIVEVKSSTSVKEEYIPDLAVQRHCYEQAGLRVRKCRLIHINSEYVRRGAVSARGLFAEEDVTELVEANTAGIGKRIQGMHDVIRRKECPRVEIGPHCDAPYECPLRYICWRKVFAEENNIFTLYRLRGDRKWDLYGRGILRNRDLPEDLALSPAQQIQVAAERTGRLHVDKVQVRTFLSKLEYPLHFLDFETFNAAIPLVDRTRPFQQVPFQYSLDVLRDKASVPRHHSWLWDGTGDPRELMLAKLVDLIEGRGSVVAYNAAFELSRLNEAVEAFPKRAKFARSVAARMVDLLEPFRSFLVYHPSQHGSASVKQVLPALTGKGYENLAISDGGQASQEFLRVTFGEVSAKERKEVRRQLEEYCGLDTKGMVDILSALSEIPGVLVDNDGCRAVGRREPALL
jgi:hypothetical protein